MDHKQQRIVLVGDVHGCLEEFKELLEVVQYEKAKDRLISAGDLVDRGPDPVGVVRFARELGIETILGNHEEKHLRYRKHEQRVAASKGTNKLYKNPMKPFRGVRMEEHLRFTPEDWAYMEKMPLFLRLDCSLPDDGCKKWVVCHGGLIPGKTVEEQDPKLIIRARYLDENNALMPLEDDFSAPPSGTFWTQRWQGPENVVYGHNVHSEESIREDHGPDGIKLLGIDTGCCFGGRLTAIVLENNHGPLTWTETHQVKAKKVYFSRHEART